MARATRCSSPPDGYFAALAGAGEIMVNSLHGQGIDQPAPGLRVEAVAPDGLIEAVSLPGARFVVGVQWHPEYKPLENPISRALFAAFRRGLPLRPNPDPGQNGAPPSPRFRTVICSGREHAFCAAEPCVNCIFVRLGSIPTLTHPEAERTPKPSYIRPRSPLRVRISPKRF